VGLMSWTTWYDHIISKKIDRHVNYDNGSSKRYDVVDNILHLMAIDEIQYKEADAIYVEFGNPI
jgi:hypothetical protein